MKSADVLNLLGVVLTLVATVSGGGSLLLVRRTRRKLDADAAQVVSGAAVTLVKPLEERLERMEARATRAEERATSAEERLRVVETRAHRLGLVLKSWREAIMDPAATLERLRDMVGQGPAT